MNVADSMKRLKNGAPDSPNGHGGSDSEGGRELAFVPSGGPLQVLMVIAPIAIAGTAFYLVQQRRPDGAARTVAGGGAKAKAKRRRPRSLLRYYGLGVVIAALERESTRKAVIAGLKLAQKRA
jgi:hypothetical protein